MKFNSIQVLRAVAVNLVLAAHLSVIEIKYGAGVAVFPDWIGLGGAAGVNLFFVISGFVMSLVARDSNWRDFIKARLIRIYPVYWIYTTLVLVAFLIRPEIVNQSFAHPPSILLSYLLWPQDVHPLLAVGWTLIHEMYFYIVMAGLIAFRIPLVYALCLWAAVVVVAPLIADTSSPVAAVLFHPATLEFILGAAIGLWLPHIKARIGGVCVLLGIVLLIAGGMIYNSDIVQFDDQWKRVAFLGFPFVPLVYGAVAIERDKAWRVFPIASTLGDASYSTYLSHVMVVSILGRAFAGQSAHNIAAESIFVVLCFVAANAFGIVSFVWLERPIIAALRRRLSHAAG